MRLTDVLVATNMNPLYYKFIPIFIKTWDKLFPNVKVTILIVADKLIDELRLYKENIVLFPPIENMDSGFIAQNIRLLYPALMESEGGILITDMDIFPMNHAYYINPISSYDNTKFITYRPLSVVGKNEMAICYNIATNTVWKDVFNINKIEDIQIILKYLYKNKKYEGENAHKLDQRGAYLPGWITDQLYLFEKITEWNNKTNNHIILNDCLFRRLDRNECPDNSFEHIRSDIENGVYSDYHSHRPYDKYKKIVDLLIDAVPYR